MKGLGKPEGCSAINLCYGNLTWSVTRGGETKQCLGVCTGTDLGLRLVVLLL